MVTTLAQGGPKTFQWQNKQPLLGAKPNNLIMKVVELINNTDDDTSTI